MMRWLPHGWTITITTLRGSSQWQYEACADGIEPIKGPLPHERCKSLHEARRLARQALRRKAFGLMTTGWSPSSCMAHGMILGQSTAICNEKIKLDDQPGRGCDKECPQCARCDKIQYELEEMFPDQEEC